jgi:hypothetical protein
MKNFVGSVGALTGSALLVSPMYLWLKSGNDNVLWMAMFGLVTLFMTLVYAINLD